jgi:hypothetical protein
MMTTQATQQNVTLTDAELAVLCAALEIDASPFITDGPLLALAQPDLTTTLEDARDALLARGLASVVDGTGLVPAPEIASLLRTSAESANGFEVLSANADAAARIQFNSGLVDGVRSLVTHQFLAEGAHVFATARAEAAELAEAIGNAVMAAAQMPAMPAVPQAQRERTFAISHQLIHSLAANAHSNSNALRAALTQAGMDENAANAFLAAGQQPSSQGVFTALRLNQQRLQAGTLMWFADATSCWLVTNINEQGNALLVRGGADELRAAVTNMVQQTLV